MSVLYVRLKKGMFVLEGKPCDRFQMGGFQGQVFPDGSINIDQIEGDGGVHIHIQPDGYYVKFLAKGKETGKIPLSDGKVSGWIGMYQNKGYSFLSYRTDAFHEFMIRHDIAARKDANPNRRTYQGEITTDGQIQEMEDGCKKVLNATYVIEYLEERGNVLYTDVKDVLSLNLEKEETADSDR